MTAPRQHGRAEACVARRPLDPPEVACGAVEMPSSSDGKLAVHTLMNVAHASCSTYAT